MHGPNGANYPNESVFREIQPDTKIVIGHVSQPRFTLTVTLTARGDKTHLAWVQEFESPRSLRRCAPFANPPTSRTSTGFSRYSRVKVPEAEPGAAADRQGILAFPVSEHFSIADQTRFKSRRQFGRR